MAYLKIALLDKNWTEVMRVKGVLVEMMQEDAYGYVVRSRYQNNAAEEIASKHPGKGEAYCCGVAVAYRWCCVKYDRRTLRMPQDTSTERDPLL